MLRQFVACLAFAVLLVACSSNNNKPHSAATRAPAATLVAALATSAANASPPAPPSASPPSTPAPSCCAAPGCRATDQALEAQLNHALLTEAELPQGFTAQETTTDVTLPGQTAETTITFTKVGQSATGLDIHALVIGLGGFKDAASAQTQFAGVQQEIQHASAGADIKLTPVPVAPKVGDQAQAFMVSASSQGFTLTGYAIVWQHGKVDAFLVQVGVTPVDENQVTQLAQRQDAKLGAAVNAP
jgi:hypothetical protein